MAELVLGGMSGLAGVAIAATIALNPGSQAFGPLAIALITLLLAWGSTGVLGGLLLLRRGLAAGRPWTVAFYGLCLVAFPLGTALGIYAFYVLFQSEARAPSVGARA